MPYQHADSAGTSPHFHAALFERGTLTSGGQSVTYKVLHTLELHYLTRNKASACKALRCCREYCRGCSTFYMAGSATCVLWRCLLCSGEVLIGQLGLLSRAHNRCLAYC